MNFQKINNSFCSLVSLVRNNAYPTYPEFTTFISRLKTFNLFPLTSSQDKYSLAESGFIYSGKKDIVECFCCSLILHHWEKEDNPWIEHSRWNSKCVFVLLSKGNQFIENVVKKYGFIELGRMIGAASTMKNIPTTESNVSNTLVRRRVGLMSELSAHFKFIMGFEESTVAYQLIDIRLEQIQNTVKQFQEIQDKIEDLDDSVEDNQSHHRIQFNELACNIQASLLTLQSKKTKPVSIQNEFHTNDSMRLPSVPAPVFDGNIQNWPSFKDSFDAMFHNNKGLAEVQKLHYLKACMCYGVRSIEPTNYEWDAWLVTLLCYKLDNITVGEWQLLQTTKELPKFTDLEVFLSNRISAYELHNDQPPLSETKDASNIEEIVPPKVLCAQTNKVMVSGSVPQHHAVLATAIINIYNASGQPQQCRAILDSGSQLSFMTKACAKRLQLKNICESTSIEGIGSTSLSVSRLTPAIMSSRTYSTALTFHCIPVITSDLPSCKVKVDELSIPSIIRQQLADPQFHEPRPVDCLLVADVFFEIFYGEKMAISNTLVAHSTALGWVVTSQLQLNH
ncbi:hypothetical protein AGLY_003325 [Aphis glycines]|uniref:Uncharacterized protein n=1 Tax=Aphis glycines TaxID=307491 RepID=A0A6G0U076_APHGL|nr:hypothetical protein AGLY_003325 [Aphis glycines]